MATAGAKMTIACKIAIAWFQLQLCEQHEVSENTQTGPRTIKQWARIGPIVRIRGTAYPRGTPPEGFPAKPEMVGGYALTHGISKDFWDKWVEQHKGAPYVTSGMIMAYEDPEMAKGFGRERAKELSGLEPLNPNGDQRVPRSTHVGVSSVEIEDSRRARLTGTEAA